MQQNLLRQIRRRPKTILFYTGFYLSRLFVIIVLNYFRRDCEFFCLMVDLITGKFRFTSFAIHVIEVYDSIFSVRLTIIVILQGHTKKITSWIHRILYQKCLFKIDFNYVTQFHLIHIYMTVYMGLYPFFARKKAKINRIKQLRCSRYTPKLKHALI